MSAKVRRHANTLALLAKAKPALCQAVVKGADKDFIHCLCECAHNILKGSVSLTKAQKAKLARYKQGLRNVVKKTTSLQRKRKIFQTGGFLPALLGPLLAPVIAPLATRVIGKILK